MAASSDLYFSDFLVNMESEGALRSGCFIADRNRSRSDVLFPGALDWLVLPALVPPNMVVGKPVARRVLFPEGWVGGGYETEVLNVGLTLQGRSAAEALRSHCRPRSLGWVWARGTTQ